MARRVTHPPGYSIIWLGQFDYLELATQKLKLVVPFTLVIIFVLPYFVFRSFPEAALIIVTLPFALIGGLCERRIQSCKQGRQNLLFVVYRYDDAQLRGGEGPD